LAGSFRLVFGLALALAVSVMIAPAFFSKLLTGDSSYGLLIVLYALSLPLAAYATTAGPFLQGLKRVNTLARINVARSFLTVLVIIPLVYWMGLFGAALSVVIGAVIQLGLTWRAVSKEPQHYSVFVAKAFDAPILRALFQYGTTSLLVGITYYLSHLLLKMVIVSHLGLEINGIYQPIWALTMSYLTLVLTSMSAYSYPRLCELTESRAISEELNGIVRVSLLLIVPVMFALLICRRPIILMLYDTAFLDAAKYMPIQIFGDFFKVFSWALGMYLLPAKRLKWFVIVNLLQEVLMVALAYLWVDRYQLYGIAAAFAMSYIVSCLLLVWYSRRTIGFRLWRNNFWLLNLSGLTIAGVGVCVNLHTFWLKGALCSGCVILWAVVSVKREELGKVRLYAMQKIHHIIKRQGAGAPG
jgi:O-antigen/teichoic acid export membrane protein